MRLIGIVVTGVLATAVIAEGAYIYRTRSQLAGLQEKLEVLSTERAEADLWRGGGGSARPDRGRDDDGDVGDEDRRSGSRLPPPRFNAPAGQAAAPTPPSSDPLPLPPALASEESREQLRQFILAQLERERQEARERQNERRQERESQWRERVTKELNLSPAETEKFNQILSNTQARRAELQAKIQAGQIDGQSIRTSIQSLREESSKELRSLLGDQRAQKYEELRRSEGGRGGPDGGGFRRFGGGPRGPGGGAGPGGGGPPAQ